MTVSLWELSLASFRDQTASEKATPGGGSVCAVSGSLGLGLVLMALALTRRRSNATLASELDAQIARGHAALGELSSAADDDVRAFEAYMTARRLSRQTEAAPQTQVEASPQEREQRAVALRLASNEASRAPLIAARAALDALAVAEQAAALSSLHVLSDVVAGAELLNAAVVGLLATLSMNLRVDDHSPEQLDLQKEHDSLASLRERAIEAVRARVKSRSAGA